MIEVKCLQPGTRLIVGSRHPHGPCIAVVIGVERLAVVDDHGARCRHEDDHNCMDGFCASEFFVFSKDIKAVAK